MSAPPVLSPHQQQAAKFIYDRAVQRGIAPERAVELAAAAYSESGLNPEAKNPSSGAAGFFQLLSKGYVDKANAAGGVFDPAANTDAILPDYANYWKQHPNAAPGEAARDVERSGEGAGFYTKGLGALGFLGKGGGPKLAPLAAVATPQAASGPDPRRQFAMAIAAGIGQRKDPHRLLDALVQLRQGLQRQPSTDVVAPQAASGPVAAGSPVANLTSRGGEHPTAGLDGFPAYDYFAPAGSAAVSPVDGVVVRLSGHDPKLGPIDGPHGPLGWSVYIKGADGHVRFLTHMGSRNVGVGQRVKAGETIGTVADYDRYGTPSHIHMGTQ